MATYNYPHVDITTKALTRRTPAATESTATTLLAPFVCDRGPDNELVDIDSMADFVATFGNLDYSVYGQRQILNIGKWLSAGGRVKALRITEAQYSEPNLVSDDSGIGQFKFDSDSMSGATVSIKYGDDISVELSLSDKAYAYYGNNVVTSVSYASTAKTADDDAKMDFINAELDASEFFDTTNNNGNIRKGTKALLRYEATAEKKDKQTYTVAWLYFISGEYEFPTNIKIMIPVNAENDAKNATAGKLIKNTSSETLGLVFAEAKYPGKYYNGMQLQITTAYSSSAGYRISVSVYKDQTLIEKFQRVSVEKLYTIEESSEYIGDFSIRVLHNKEYVDIMDIDSSADYEELLTRLVALGTVKINLGDKSNVLQILSNESDDKLNEFATIEGTSIDGTTIEDTIDSALVPSMKIALKQPLESEFDVMIDCGYPESVKRALINLFSRKVDSLSNLVRDDAFLYLTPYVIEGNGRSKEPTEIGDMDDLFIDVSSDDMAFNVAVYDYYGKVIDLYSADSGKEVFVPATYELAGKIPANDASYGVQYPTAGLTRGKVSDLLWINEIPTNADKNSHYENRLNYIEKDSRGMYFMCQLTRADGDTALKFINNSRALLKIKKELRRIARNYLHEFNDRITKNNLLNALNTSLANWINNRTLSYGSITLQDYTENDTLSNEELLIQLDVKFTGTIEVISIDITVE